MRVTPERRCPQYTDAETGFVYLRARYYDPVTGQFISRDPIEALTREPYGYVGGNPLNATDPLGLLCLAGTNPNGSCRGSGAVKTVVGAAQDAGEFVSRNRGTIATVAAIGTCLIPAVGLTFGLGGAFEALSGPSSGTLGAGIGALQHSTRLNYLGRFFPAGWDTANLFGWLDEQC